MKRHTKQSKAIASAIGKHTAYLAFMELARKYDRNPCADPNEHPTYASVMRQGIEDIDSWARIHGYPAAPAIEAFANQFCCHFELSIKDGWCTPRGDAEAA